MIGSEGDIRHRTPATAPTSNTNTHDNLRAQNVLPSTSTTKKIKKMLRYYYNFFTFRFTLIFIIGIVLFCITLYFLHLYLPSSTKESMIKKTIIDIDSKNNNEINDKMNDQNIINFGFNDYPFDIPFEFRNISKYKTIIAIGDLHGDMSQTLKILRKSGIIDKKHNWIANYTILIQTGDIVDRGSESIEVYELFLKLRISCLSLNSLVLQIIGNHEHMNFVGDYRFVNALEMNDKIGGNSFWTKIFSIEHKIGYFLRHTPIVRIIGHTLFVHAGLRPGIVSKFNGNITYINEIFRLSIIGGLENGISVDMLLGVQGPIWTRTFDIRFYDQNMMNEVVQYFWERNKIRINVRDKEKINEYMCIELEQTLKMLNVKRMVIGHNVQAEGIPNFFCGKKLIAIDVGMSYVYGGRLGAIRIDIQSDTVSIIR